MKTIYKIFFGSTICLQISCVNDNSHLVDSFIEDNLNYEAQHPIWSGVDTSKLDLKFGQVVKFTIDTVEMDAVLIDFYKENTQNYYGFCFLNGSRLFGRQIPGSGLLFDCLQSYSVFYLKSEFTTPFKLLEKLDADQSKVMIGSMSFPNNDTDIIRLHSIGIEERMKKLTPCNEGKDDLNANRNTYFDLETILKN